MTTTTARSVHDLLLAFDSYANIIINLQWTAGQRKVFEELTDEYPAAVAALYDWSPHFVRLSVPSAPGYVTFLFDTEALFEVDGS